MLPTQVPTRLREVLLFQRAVQLIDQSICAMWPMCSVLPLTTIPSYKLENRKGVN